MADIYKNLREAIMTYVEANADKVAVVYRADQPRFSEWPAVIVTPSDNDSDYGDTSMKKMDITFIVRAHYLMSQDGQQEADEAMDEIIDQLLTIFLDSTVLDATACEWVNPTPGVWGYQDREVGMVRTAEIKLKCRKYLEF